MSKFPQNRMRRLRTSRWIRDLVSEVNLTTNDLILPLFITSQQKGAEKIKTLPDVFRLGEYELFKQIEDAIENGIRAIALFPVIDDEYKNEKGSFAYDEGNFLFSRIRDIKHKFPDIGVIADVALDPYTSHGHDGVIDDSGYVLNDETNELLVKQALALAAAGTDIVAPSDMMDGRVGAIRTPLEKQGYKNVMILSYAAKYASKLYGPFRDAVGSGLKLGSGNKNTYQMSPYNIKEALREVELDIDEGADIVLIKPAMFYQDVIKEVANNFNIPLFAYQVSGEYSMMKFAAKEGAFRFEDVLFESLVSLKRSGVDAILTYGALEAAKLIKGK